MQKWSDLIADIIDNGKDTGRADKNIWETVREFEAEPDNYDIDIDLWADDPRRDEYAFRKSNRAF